MYLFEECEECGLDTVRDKRDPRATELTVFTFPHPTTDDFSQEYTVLIKTGFLIVVAFWSQSKHKLAERKYVDVSPTKALSTKSQGTTM